MPELNFTVESAGPQRGVLTPHLVFRLRLTEAGGVPVQAVLLRCQIHVEPARRGYTAPEQERLHDLFGTPERWGQTLRGLLWAQVNVVAPPFTGSTTVELPVPCSHDFNLAATRYFDALEGGDAPLCFLFSGTLFHEGPDGGLQVAQIAWEKEANFRLPAPVWRELMDRHYPEGGLLCLPRDVLDRLARYRSQSGLATWEQALDRLLNTAEEPVTP